MLECLNCDAPIAKTYQNTGKFCSQQCQGKWKIKQTNLKIEAGEGKRAAHIKRYLIEKHGDRCMDPNCAWDFDKRHVPVELEHIDGNSENNKLDNLKLLCPNCHSLTPTYKAKNKGNGRHARMERYKAGLSF